MQNLICSLIDGAADFQHHHAKFIGIGLTLVVRIIAALAAAAACGRGVSHYYVTPSLRSTHHRCWARNNHHHRRIIGAANCRVVIRTFVANLRALAAAAATTAH